MERSLNFKNFINIIKIAGAYLSFSIGAGIATGQEIKQYYTSNGIYAYGSIIIAFCLYTYMTLSYLRIGYEKQFENPLQIIDYYCGEKIGKVCSVLSVCFLFLAPTVMIGGFGASLNQFFSIPHQVGSILLGILSTLTVLLGLNKVVDILGTIGPIIIVIVLLTGVIFLFKNHSGIMEGIKIAPEIKTTKMSDYWWLSGTLAATWSPLISAPYLAALSKVGSSKKQVSIAAVLGNVLFIAGITLIASSIFCDYKVIGTKLVPSLYMAQSISKILGWIYLCIIFLGIYSSATPLFFTLCSSFFTEKTKKYNIFTVVIIACSTFCAILLPFDVLFNLVFGAYGYLGIVFILFMIYKQVKEKKIQNIENNNGNNLNE